MSSGISKTADEWLQHNLNNGEVVQGTLLDVSVGRFRLVILPLILLASSAVIATLWYQKTQLNLVTLADRIGYSLLLAVVVGGALTLRRKPALLRPVMAAVVITFIIHLLVAYYTEMGNTIYLGQSSNYELVILALWLPLGYVASFVFLSPRAAVRASLVLYTAISLPLVVLLFVEQDMVLRHIAVAILISQPVYIAALWGVGLLKTFTRGIHELARNMSTAASVDALTGIANRRALYRVLEELTQARVTKERAISVLMLDVDYFKKINDNFGHGVGDEVLKRLAEQANLQLRTTDLIGRWGGEEFLIVSLDQTPTQSMQMAERLRAALAQVDYAGVGSVTVSMGVTGYHPGESIDAFVNRADMALYRAKENGRNRVEAIF